MGTKSMWKRNDIGGVSSRDGRFSISPRYRSTVNPDSWTLRDEEKRRETHHDRQVDAKSHALDVLLRERRAARVLGDAARELYEAGAYVFITKEEPVTLEDPVTGEEIETEMAVVYEAPRYVWQVHTHFTIHSDGPDFTSEALEELGEEAPRTRSRTAEILRRALHGPHEIVLVTKHRVWFVLDYHTSETFEGIVHVKEDGPAGPADLSVGEDGSRVVSVPREWVSSWLDQEGASDLWNAIEADARLEDAL